MFQLLCDELNRPLRALKHLPPHAADVYTRLSELRRRLSDAHAQLQVVSCGAVRSFSDYCRQQARDVITEHMPSGKAWRKKGVTGSCTSLRLENVDVILFSCEIFQIFYTA